MVSHGFLNGVYGKCYPFIWIIWLYSSILYGFIWMMRFYMSGFVVLCGGFLSRSCNPRKQNTNHRLYCRLVTPFFLVGPRLRIDCSPRGSMITTK